jgi:hypothetical protein
VESVARSDWGESLRGLEWGDAIWDQPVSQTVEEEEVFNPAPVLSGAGGGIFFFWQLGGCSLFWGGKFFLLGWRQGSWGKLGAAAESYSI